eukprot:TRINITY_DN5384_c0_g2_i2.p1 TRINITY_DN5384_c0_g2~~TRINITY_DN5384_c0_g2_i2.p1  ORF type:complete len:115 (+),score=31.35 TRINITY_DN5384_c0_g2_i2:33-377(+)
MEAVVSTQSTGDTTAKLWDLRQHKEIETLNGHKDIVLSVLFSPCGRWLVSGSKDKSVQFWDVRLGLTSLILHGHTNSVISMGMCGNAHRGNLVTASGDCRAKLWEFEVGKFLPK